MDERRPARPAGETPGPERDEESRKRRKRRKEEREAAAAEEERAEETDVEEKPEAPEEGPDVEVEPPSEAEVRKVAAEAAFRRRVELAELRDAIGEDAYAELREEHGPGLSWYLEEGPVLLRSVVAETEPEAGLVRRIRLKFDVARETNPVPPPRMIAAVREAFREPVPAKNLVVQAEAVAADFPREETAELTVETEDHGPVLVVIECGEVTVHESEDPDSPVIGKRVVPAGPDSAPPAETAPPTVRDVEAIVAESAADPEPPLPESSFAVTLEAVERAWIERRLPPISGGAPEPGELPLDVTVRPESRREEPVIEEEPREPREERPERPPVPPVPEDADQEQGPSPSPRERRPGASQSSRPRRPRIRFPELPEIPLPEGLPPLPDAETRRKAKRMLRKLASRFGLRLTPDLEGYLMQIVFRLRYVDGRLRRGIGVNIDVLTRIMEALREHYPLYSPKRPS
ncbi:MAG TPA: hypothetical protein VIF43_00835 [Patescibacteria group bacterium]|jgi:hypothetical protein